jgi:hypothetical protein
MESSGFSVYLRHVTSALPRRAGAGALIATVVAVCLVLTGPTPTEAAKFGPPKGKCRGIPGRIVPDPVGISGALIRETNAWVTASCKHVTAVYGGHAPTPEGNDSDTGRFLVLRQNTSKGTQTIDLIDLPATGDTTIIAAPLGKKAEKRKVQRHGTLRFATATGQQGTLYLGNDTAVLDPVAAQSGI